MITKASLLLSRESLGCVSSDTHARVAPTVTSTPIKVVGAAGVCTPTIVGTTYLGCDSLNNFVDL